MVAILPLIAGAIGSALLGKLLDTAISGNGTPPINEGGVTGGGWKSNEGPSVAGSDARGDNIQQASLESLPELVAVPNAQGDDSNAHIDGAALINELINNPSTQPNQTNQSMDDGEGNSFPWLIPAAAGAAGAGAGAAAASKMSNAVDAAKANALAGNTNNQYQQARAQLENNNYVDADFENAPEQGQLNQQAQKQLTGPQNKLPAPEESVINLPDETSGKTINAESGVLDKKQAKSFKDPKSGKIFWIQGDIVFNNKGNPLGNVSKIIPGNIQGVLRTLGIISRGK